MNIRKIVMILALAAILSVSTAFADHPGGFGIGIQGGGVGSWYGGGFGNAALTLKFPKVPIFWAIDFSSWGDHFWLGLAGDYYLIDKQIVETLHWYLGVGGYLSLGFANDYFGLGIAGRIPVGLSWQPLDLLEIYIQIVPSIGINILPGVGLGGGFGGNIGIRLWF